jgi:hypothetical protein
MNSHGTTRKTQTLLANIPCFFVCFRGHLGVIRHHTRKVSVIGLKGAATAQAVSSPDSVDSPGARQVLATYKLRILSP